MWRYNLLMPKTVIILNKTNKTADKIPKGNKADNINVPFMDLTPSDENQEGNRPIK